MIPWALSDSNSIRSPSPRLDPNRTVFVGGLHGLINAGQSSHNFNYIMHLTFVPCTCILIFSNCLDIVHVLCGYVYQKCMREREYIYTYIIHVYILDVCD